MDSNNLTRLSNHGYKMDKILGYGSFGRVYMADCSVASIQPELMSSKVAVKIVEDRAVTLSEGKSKILSRYQSLEKIKSLKHDNVIVIFKFILLPPTNLEPSLIAIVMEYCEGGSLRSVVDQGLSWTQLIDYTGQITNGLAYLHKHKVLHCDIKPGNILLANKHRTGLFQTVKIADVDDPILLRLEDTVSSDVTHPVGTRKYFSPEMKSKFAWPSSIVHIGRKTDIWSLGCVVLEMIEPYDTRSEPALRNYESRLLGILKGLCPLMQEFLKKCFETDPVCRASAEDLLQTFLLTKGPKLDNLLRQEEKLWTCCQCTQKPREPHIQEKSSSQLNCTIHGTLNKCDLAKDSMSSTKGSRILGRLIDQKLNIELTDSDNSWFYKMLQDELPLLGIAELRVNGLQMSPQFRVDSFLRLKTLSVYGTSVMPSFRISSESLRSLRLSAVTGWRAGMISNFILPNLEKLALDLLDDSTVGTENLEKIPQLTQFTFSATEKMNCKDLSFSSQSVATVQIYGEGNLRLRLERFLFPNMTSLKLVRWPFVKMKKKHGALFPRLEVLKFRYCQNIDIEMDTLATWSHLTKFFVFPVLPEENCLMTKVQTLVDQANYLWLVRYLIHEDIVVYEDDDVNAEPLLKFILHKWPPPFRRAKFVHALAHTLGCQACGFITEYDADTWSESHTA